MRTRLLVLSIVLASTSLALADNWPNWRGPTNDGHCQEKDFPLKFGPTENVKWKAPLPDQGNSTPVVWGDKVFVTQASDKIWPPKPGSGGPAAAKKRSLICFNRADGKILWQQDVIYPEMELTHGTNPFCSASPVTDGERVVVSHGSAGMFCYDMNGKELWKKDLGKLEHIWGNASSPIIYKNLVIMWAGPGERQFLLSVDKKTGAKVWQHDEPGGKSGSAGSKEWVGSWATPLVARVGNRDEMIVPCSKVLKAFNPATGELLWSCEGLGNLFYTSPVISKDGIVVAMSGFHGPALAVRAGGKGDVTKTHRLWHHTKGIKQRIGSPIVVGDKVYIFCDPSPAQCFDIKTGAELGTRDGLIDKCWSSPLLAGDRFYLPSWDGNVHVVKASPEFDVLATNSFKEPILSSIAASDGELFIRTYKHLWCIGKKGN